MRTIAYTLLKVVQLIFDSGNVLVIGGSTSALLGLTWGGVRYSCGSAQVLVPFILGLAAIVAFFVYEAFVPTEPTVPWRILNNRTTISGYVLYPFVRRPRLMVLVMP